MRHRRNTVKDVLEPIRKKTKNSRRVSSVFAKIKQFVFAAASGLAKAGKKGLEYVRGFLEKKWKREPNYLENVSSIRKKRFSLNFDGSLQKNQIFFSKTTEQMANADDADKLGPLAQDMSFCRIF